MGHQALVDSIWRWANSMLSAVSHKGGCWPLPCHRHRLLSYEPGQLEATLWSGSGPLGSLRSIWRWANSMLSAVSHWQSSGQLPYYRH
jgi:hypothetical protein